MGLREVVRPTGPLPASVYWLRRAAVVLPVLVVVVALVVLASSGSSSSSPGTTHRTPPASGGILGTTPTVPSTAGPTTTGVSTTASSTVPAGGATTAPATPTPTCAAGTLSVVVASARRVYPVGAEVRFTTTLRTTGPACVADGALALVVTSGSDRVWGSDDCAAAIGVRTPLAAAGAQSVVRGWDRGRTIPSCGQVIGTTTALAGEYRVTAVWGGVSSTQAVFTLS